MPEIDYSPEHHQSSMPIDTEPLFSGTAENSKQERMIRSAFPEVAAAVEHGVRFHKITSDDFLNQIGNTVHAGDVDTLREWSAHSTVGCQSGIDRSHDYVLLSDALSVPVATTVEGKSQILKALGRSAQVGMSLERLGKRIASGTAMEEGVVPKTFDTSIDTVIAFTDHERDLTHIDELSAGIKEYCEKNNITDMNMDVVIVVGDGRTVRAKIQELKDHFGIDDDFRSKRSSRE